jgi:thymidylate kinase
MCGKSTIAKALSERTNVPIFKMEVSKHFWDFLIHQRYAGEAITQMLEQTKQSVILDRSFLSDYMYATLFNRAYDLKKHFDTDERFAKMNALIVYCFKDEEKFQEDKEDADFIKVSDYKQMMAHYETVLNETTCRFIKINTSDENLEAQLETIIKNI